MSEENRIIDWLNQVILEEGYQLVNLNYIFCPDDYLLEINKEYLGHDYFTDVITFPLSDEGIEGDIFISVDRVSENAKNLKLTFEEELLRVMVHGLLHLLGYSDKNAKDKIEMTNKENYYLSNFSG